MHQVACCAVDDRGKVALSVGSVDAPVFLRSSAKPFIAATVMASGAREKFGFEVREIAVMAASHSGEPFHVAAVASILRKIGMDAGALQCGTHAPYDERAAADLQAGGQAPSALHNNCSGKHAGILALCKAIGADPATYMDVDNPAQQRILAFCARMSDDDARRWPLGVDGCGIPVYATPLRNAALSFARLATQHGVADTDARALRVVRDAMIEYPEYIAGTGTFDTELMRVGDGSIASKAGAEGVHAVSSIPQGLGFVSKVLDGGPRGRAPLTVAALRALGSIDAAQATKLASFARPVVYNRAGRAVGEIRARDVAVLKAK